MPVTAKLSRSFYYKLGDEIATELVEWFNSVDSSQREAFRELFEANFARIETRLAELDPRFETRFASLESRIASLEARFDARVSSMEARLESRMDAKLEALKSELLKWMFLFWVGTMGTVIAIIKL